MAELITQIRDHQFKYYVLDAPTMMKMIMVVVMMMIMMDNGDEEGRQ